MIEKRIEVDLAGETKPFRHFFAATGYANADFTYTPALQRLYDHLSSYPGHPEYMRMHNIMTCHGRGDYYVFSCNLDYGNPEETAGSDIVVRRNEKGFEYDWKTVDEVYDTLIGHGMHPIVEMCYMPTAIRHSKYECLPSSFRDYHEVLKAFVSHWTKRYGQDEVSKWYFEVTNEPDNYEILVERTEYFLAMYDYFEDAVHSVSESYRAGGPAVKQWDEGMKIFSRFLDHCENGINYISGEYGTRVDFISVHCKAGRPDMVGPQMSYMFDSLRKYIEEMKKHPSLIHTTFFNDESDIVWDGNRGIGYKSWLNFRNTEYAPAFMCKMMSRYVDVLVDELETDLAIVDSDNCHLLWEKSLFSGNRSQMTPLGSAPTTDIIKKGFFNAGHLLGKLGDERYMLRSDDAEFEDKYGVLATRYDGGGYAIMIWNAEDGLDGDVNARRISVDLGCLDSRYVKLVYRIDKEHSNAYAAWKRLGCPAEPGKMDARMLRENDSLFVDPNAEFVGPGDCTLSFDMPMHSVVLVVLAKPEEREEELRILRCEQEKSSSGNAQIFLSWQYSTRHDFMGYAVLRDGERISRNLLTAATYVDSDVEIGETHEYSIEAYYATGKKTMNSTVTTVRS